MRWSLGYHLYACGKKGLPAEIQFNGNTYRLNERLKHDFFAATGLYKLNSQPHTKETQSPAKIILKVTRKQNFLGLPLSWLGSGLCHRELSILRRLKDLDAVPKPLLLYGKTGFIYEYIEGFSLDEDKDLPKDFFDKFLELLKQVHRRNIVYLDMNKRGNILVGSDGRPHLIDFQISLYIGEHFLIWPRLSARLRAALQREDIYHVYKHKSRLCPELLTPAEHTLSRRISILIRLHRSATRPLQKLRRAFLKFLHSKGLMITEKKARYSRENDPARFGRY